MNPQTTTTLEVIQHEVGRWLAARDYTRRPAFNGRALAMSILGACEGPRAQRRLAVYAELAESMHAAGQSEAAIRSRLGAVWESGQ